MPCKGSFYSPGILASNVANDNTCFLYRSCSQITSSDHMKYLWSKKESWEWWKHTPLRHVKQENMISKSILIRNDFIRYFYIKIIQCWLNNGRSVGGAIINYSSLISLLNTLLLLACCYVSGPLISKILFTCYVCMEQCCWDRTRTSHAGPT